MSFKFPTPPNMNINSPAKLHYVKYAAEQSDVEGGLVDNPTLQAWFIDNVCELAFGDDAMSRYSAKEIFERLEEFSNDALAWTEMKEEHDVKVHIDDMDYQRQCSH